MKRSVTVFAFTVAVLFIFGAAPPASAFSAAQVSGVTFQYHKSLNGVYVFNGTVISVGFTVTNIGSQWTTFLACPSQRVVFDGGGYGDSYLLGCATISLGAVCLTNTNWCVTSSGTVSIPGIVYASAPGQLLIRVLVYDTGTSATVPITTSQWYPVGYIVPQIQPSYSGSIFPAP